MTALFGATSLTCLSSISIGDSVDVQEIECAGATSKEVVVGLSSITVTIAGALEKTDVTLINAIAPGTIATATIYPTGNTSTFIKVAALVATVVDRSIDMATTGFGTYSITLRFDDIAYTAVA